MGINSVIERIVRNMGRYDSANARMLKVLCNRAIKISADLNQANNTERQHALYTTLTAIAQELDRVCGGESANIFKGMRPLVQLERERIVFRGDEALNEFQAPPRGHPEEMINAAKQDKRELFAQIKGLEEAGGDLLRDVIRPMGIPAQPTTARPEARSIRSREKMLSTAQPDGPGGTEDAPLMIMVSGTQIFSPVIPLPTVVTTELPRLVASQHQSSPMPANPDILSNIEHEIPNLSGRVWKSCTGTVIIGTYSTVYPGVFDDKKVAIKVLRMAKDIDTTQRRFRRELYIWWQLQHVNVLPLFGYFVTNDGGHLFPCLVSEWAERGSAAEYIRGHLSWEQRVALLNDVAQGLKYLHEVTPLIVHADLKPQNVLVDRNGVGQLCDFGLTRFIQDGETELTTTTAYTGTTRYLAYELVEYDNKPIPTTATDIYALGCIGLEFIYQVRPYASLQMNYGRISRAIGDGKPPAKRPDNPEDAVPLLWDLLEACWSYAPEDRPTAIQVSKYLAWNLPALTVALNNCSWTPEYQD